MQHSPHACPQEQQAAGQHCQEVSNLTLQQAGLLLVVRE